MSVFKPQNLNLRGVRTVYSSYRPARTIHVPSRFLAMSHKLNRLLKLNLHRLVLLYICIVGPMCCERM